MSGALCAPKPVSAFIRFARYAAFFSGIAYGATRMKMLKSREAVIQESENKIRAEIACRKQREQEAKMQLEMNQLAKEAGILK